MEEKIPLDFGGSNDRPISSTNVHRLLAYLLILLNFVHSLDACDAFASTESWKYGIATPNSECALPLKSTCHAPHMAPGNQPAGLLR